MSRLKAEPAVVGEETRRPLIVVVVGVHEVGVLLVVALVVLVLVLLVPVVVVVVVQVLAILLVLIVFVGEEAADGRFWSQFLCASFAILHAGIGGGIYFH